MVSHLLISSVSGKAQGLEKGQKEVREYHLTCRGQEEAGEEKADGKCQPLRFCGRAQRVCPISMETRAGGTDIAAGGWRVDARKGFLD